MNMKILGIESSCDETAASVVSSQGGKLIIRSDIVSSQVEMHRLWGGVVPELAGRAHIECISRVTEAALDAAGISLRDLDAVAVTASPGLIGALLVGVNFAKALAVSNGMPLVPVEHVCAHITAAALLEDPPEPPFVAFAVSGGHTTIYDVQSWIDFRELGSTRDDAAGEAFDKVARVLGMPYPGGAAMDRLAYEGNPGAIHFPSPAIADAGLDFSFSGLKTAALNAIHRARQTGTEVCSADLAASFTAAVCEGIARRCREAIRLTGTRRVVVAGGVAANSHLRRALGEACAECGARLWIPPVALCGDNAAMVAASGYFHFLAGVRADERLNAFTD